MAVSKITDSCNLSFNTEFLSLYSDILCNKAILTGAFFSYNIEKFNGAISFRYIDEQIFV